MTPRHLLAISVVLACLAPAPRALAQPADAKQRAEGPFREGLALHESGKDERALSKFEEAYRQYPSGNILFNVARMEQVLGRYAAALNHYRRCLEDPNLGADNRRAAADHVQALTARVGQLALDVPDGATVTVDGSEVVSSTNVAVAPGRHLVKVTRGAQSRTIEVFSPAGAVTPVHAAFDSSEPARQGGHEAAHVEPPREERERWPAAKRVVVIGGAVVGVGLLATSGILNAVATRPEGGAPTGGCGGAGPESSECARIAADRASYDGQRSASTVLFWSGAGVGVAALGAALLWPNEHVEIRGGPVQGGGGGVIRVRF